MLTLDKNHIYRWNGVIVPGVSEILEAGGFTDFSHVPDSILIPAQKFGKAGHAACHLDNLDGLDENTLSKPLKPYLASWRKFKADYKAIIIISEAKVYSNKWGFAGTLDNIVKIKDELILIDLKTSSSMQAATELQTAAYKIAFEEQEGLKISKRWGVQLCDTGIPIIHKYNERTDEATFKGAISGYRFKKRRNLL